MSQFRFPGARWWKFDFHTHTPASDDFLKGCPQFVKDEVTPEFWLRKFMERGLDCVAITDHNSGGWIDKLQQKYEELNAIKDELDWFRPLYLFPGVEISANGDVHILAILGPGKNKGDIDQLLGAVGYQSTKGKSDGVTTKSITELVDAIAGLDGIAIPAHVDQPKGLFEQLQSQIPTLTQVLNNPNIWAMELWDENYQKPHEYRRKDAPWTEVRGSDTHNFRHDGFGNFTWIKMDAPPSIEGLRLALIDRTASVNRNMSDEPNRHAELFIEKLIIRQAQFIGRSKVFCCQFSPFLNTIIGGRGRGKSTLLEFMRLALRRQNDLPQALMEESQKYFRVEGNDHLLFNDSLISLVYRKGDVRYRLNWSVNDDRSSLEEEIGGRWESTPGEIKSLFPAYIYSQKQIFELARSPHALLEIIDEAPEVDYAANISRKRALENRYKQLDLKLQELTEKINYANRLQGEANDLARQVRQIEESGHKEILQNYRIRQQQLDECERLESKWQEMNQLLADTRDMIAPVHLNEQYFDGYEDMLSDLKNTNEQWRAVNKELVDLSHEAQMVVDKWQAQKAAALWMQMLQEDMTKYEQLRTQLAHQGIDPDSYPLLLAQQRNLHRELQQIGEYQSTSRQLIAEKQEVFEQLMQNRKALTASRQRFVTLILKDNSSVTIEVKPFGQAWGSLEQDIRRILQCPERYIKDFEHLKDIYHSENGRQIENIKSRIRGILSGDETPRDRRFKDFLHALPQESLSELDLWFPRDDLRITFGPDNQPIEQGSPGQKTAALLAFILSYGREPLLLDQPEDDLDNELIYELIVQQLRETKNRRQVIVVTHNANIVVNGDAEMVLPLKVMGGETIVTHPASIQKVQVRKAICDILEGGQQAFEQRYRRIHLEN